MKKYLSFIAAAAFIALSGCSSQIDGGAADSAAATDTAAYETDIALEVQDSEPENMMQPPQIMVEYSGDGISSAAALTLGGYKWDSNGCVTVSDSVGAVQSAEMGIITAQVDLDLVSDGEPKVGIRADSEITCVTFFPTDGSDSRTLGFTDSGIIQFPDDAANGVVSVQVKYPQGEAEYYFTVTRSQTDLSEPPALRIWSGEIGFAMVKGGYEWTVTEGDTSYTTCVDCASPWQMFENNTDLTELIAEPREILTVMLPENSRIASAVYYTAEDEAHELEYDGGKVTMPSEDISAVCCLTIEMPQGVCDYVFAVRTGTEAASSAYDPNTSQEASE